MVSEFMRNAQLGATDPASASRAGSPKAEDGETVLCAGRVIRPVPAVLGFVASSGSAVNDAELPGNWLRRVGRWVHRWAARAVAPAPMALERVGPMTLHRELTGRWPAMWPYADSAPGPGRGHDMYTGCGAYWLEFPPDAIVDRHGKVWRL